MKTFAIILVTFLFTAAVTSAQAESNPADVKAVKIVIEDYVNSVDSRNAAQLDEVLYDNCNFISYNNITNKTQEIANGEFLELIEDGKAGGWARNLNVNSVDVSGNMAVAKVEITDSRMKETGFLTLIKNDGSWKIMNVVSTLESN